MQATLIKATVKYPVDRIRTTKNGDRIKAVLTPAEGGEIELWGNPGDPAQHLKKGEAVTLAYDGRRYTLIATDPQPPSSPTPQLPSSPDVQEWVAMFEELRSALPDASENTWRSAASTLFIQRRTANN